MYGNVRKTWYILRLFIYYTAVYYVTHLLCFRGAKYFEILDGVQDRVHWLKIKCIFLGWLLKLLCWILRFWIFSIIWFSVILINNSIGFGYAWDGIAFSLDLYKWRIYVHSNRITRMHSADLGDRCNRLYVITQKSANWHLFFLSSFCVF